MQEGASSKIAERKNYAQGIPKIGRGKERR
jgi:hypothetical protein